MRLGGLATLFLFLSLAGCGPSFGSRIDPAQQKWDETAGRCRGELLLVRAPHAPNATGVTAVPGDVIEKARRFTVAVRAQAGGAPADETSATLTANHGAEASGGGISDGTGIVLDERGDILTNEHVIAGARRIDVYITGQGWCPAAIVGVDVQSDLAVIRVDARPQACSRLGGAGAVAAGRPVAALGYPSGSPRDVPTAFTGHVMSHRRSLQGDLDPAQNHFYAGLVESTASIPPGCSGGPLLDADGRVIAINTAAATDPATGRRFGYAIPMSDYTRNVVERLSRGQRVEHGYLGLLVRAQADTTVGVIVDRVIANGPADRAGIRPGDAVTQAGGTPVSSANLFAELVRGAPVGTTLDVQLRRGAQIKRLGVIVAPRPCRQTRSATPDAQG